MDDLHINKDLNNPAHPPHYDVTIKIPEINGADQIRLSPNGSIIDGCLHIGKEKFDWDGK